MSRLTIALTLAAAVALVRVWYDWHLRQRTSERLAGLARSHAAEAREDTPPARVRTFPPRNRLVAPGAGVIAAGWWTFVGLPVQVAIALGALLGVLTYLAEDYVASQRATTIETQLAAAIDLMVGSLRAGASLLAAFEAALQESDRPLRPYLQEVAGRIRLGDDPRAAVGDLQVYVPLETFRLFATSLAIHWEVGGSLATTLSTVGRTVRDRLELSRRVRAQGVESNASVAVVLMIAYVLAFLMWRTNPDRLQAFVATGIGTTMVAGVIALQAVGLVWMSRLSRSAFDR